MTQEIKMPDLGTAASEVVLVKWLKDIGEKVERGMPLCEVETDKAVTELESVAGGIVLKRLVFEGDRVEPGRVIAVVGEQGDAVPAGQAPAPADGEVKAAATADTAGSAAGRAPAIPPVIKNLAKKLGVDLAAVRGTGPGGRITRADVLNAQAAPSQPTPPDPKQAEPAATLSKNQLGVARTITASWNEIVPVTLFCKVNMDRAVALRAKERGQGAKLSFDALFIKALAGIMADVPRLKSSFAKEKLVVAESVNLGVAIGVDDDLFLPVIRNADRKSLREIEVELRGLAGKAAERKLTLEEMEGATVTVTNLGMFPVEAFTAIVPPKQCAILSIGTIEDAVRLNEAGKPVATKTCTVALTMDHRLINGRLAAQIIAGLKDAVENV